MLICWRLATCGTAFAQCAHAVHLVPSTGRSASARLNPATVRQSSCRKRFGDEESCDVLCAWRLTVHAGHEQCARRLVTSSMHKRSTVGWHQADWVLFPFAHEKSPLHPSILWEPAIHPQTKHSKFCTSQRAPWSCVNTVPTSRNQDLSKLNPDQWWCTHPSMGFMPKAMLYLCSPIFPMPPPFSYVYGKF